MPSRENPCPGCGGSTGAGRKSDIIRRTETTSIHGLSDARILGQKPITGHVIKMTIARIISACAVPCQQKNQPTSRESYDCRNNCCIRCNSSDHIMLVLSSYEFFNCRPDLIP